MKKRWILCTVAVLCIAAALLGCGKKNVGTPEDNAVVEEDDKKNDNTGEGGRLFGFSGIDMSNPFYDTLKNSVQTALEAQGDRLMVRDPASDADLQNEQIRELINEGVQAVFLCPVDWEKITPALEALKEADIPVINLDTEVKETSLVSAFVGSDNENAGYVCGQDLLVQKPDGGKIVIVESPWVNSVNERITGFEEGRPMFVRTPDSKFSLANFMRANLYTSLGALKVGLDILLKEEEVAIDRITGHGGLFKTKGVGQKNMVNKDAGETLEDYLQNKVFGGDEGEKMDPDPEDVKGFDEFIKRYRAGFPIERAAVDALK